MKKTIIPRSETPVDDEREPKTVLVVDDSPVDRRITGRLLQRLPDLKVGFACDGEEAVSFVDTNRVDLILTDLDMPNMDGLGLLTVLGQTHPTIPVVIMTGVGTEQLAFESLRRGAASYIPKISLNSHLCDIVERVLELRARHTDAVGVTYFSCFISYSHEDETFCQKLYDSLSQHNVPLWFAPKDMMGGRKIHEQIAGGIRDFDKLLLVLSSHSMHSKWVATEITHAVEREHATGSDVLFPISLVPFDEIQNWKLWDGSLGIDIAREVKKYFIRDFQDWTNESHFDRVCGQLVKDLNQQMYNDWNWRPIR